MPKGAADLPAFCSSSSSLPERHLHQGRAAAGKSSPGRARRICLPGGISRWKQARRKRCKRILSLRCHYAPKLGWGGSASQHPRWCLTEQRLFVLSWNPKQAIKRGEDAIRHIHLLSASSFTKGEPRPIFVKALLTFLSHLDVTTTLTARGTQPVPRQL